jgi:hypothetical protein
VCKQTSVAMLPLTRRHDRAAAAGSGGGDGALESPGGGATQGSWSICLSSSAYLI